MASMCRAASASTCVIVDGRKDDVKGLPVSRETVCTYTWAQPARAFSASGLRDGNTTRRRREQWEYKTGTGARRRTR